MAFQFAELDAIIVAAFVRALVRFLVGVFVAGVADKFSAGREGGATT